MNIGRANLRSIKNISFRFRKLLLSPAITEYATMVCSELWLEVLSSSCVSARAKAKVRLTEIEQHDMQVNKHYWLFLCYEIRFIK